MSATPDNVHHGSPVRFRDLGVAEHWLQNWLAEDPARLGLGQVTILAQELNQPSGGSLDILAASEDTYYSIEVQLGEVDASHGFRTIDYWARNRKQYTGKTHVAVLVAESAAGRYRTALEALAESIPLIVVELHAWKGATETIIVPDAVIVNESLDLGDAPIKKTAGGSSKTEADWQERSGVWQFHLAFVEWVKNHLGPVRVDYSPNSYIGVRRGRRVWAPLWPVSDGARLYLPDPDGSKDEESLAYGHFQERLSAVGIELGWSPVYNAGANPITVRLATSDLQKPEVQDLLRAGFEILSLNTTWSDRRALPDSEASSADAADGTVV